MGAPALLTVCPMSMLVAQRHVSVVQLLAGSSGLCGETNELLAQQQEALQCLSIDA